MLASCPPVGDARLDSPAVVKGLTDALANSNPNATPGTGMKHEQGGAIFRRPDGTYFTVPAIDPSATECHFDPLTISAAPPANEPGALLEAIYHAHPSSKGEDTYGCLSKKGVHMAQHLGDHLPIPTSNPDNNGGGSDSDWDVANQGFPSYTINKDGHIWRLDPNVPTANRASNTNKFDWKNATPGCVIP